jgi:hypothetical protein
VLQVPIKSSVVVGGCFFVQFDGFSGHGAT